MFGLSLQSTLLVNQFEEVSCKGLYHFSGRSFSLSLPELSPCLVPQLCHHLKGSIMLLVLCAVFVLVGGPVNSQTDSILCGKLVINSISLNAVLFLK